MWGKMKIGMLLSGECDKISMIEKMSEEDTG